MQWSRTLAAALVLTAASAQAQVMNSPAGGNLPAGVTPVGGIVADLIGLNGNRVVSQLAASALYVGFSNDGTPVAFRGNPLTIGIQSGFTPAILGQLGGGLAEAAFRVSLYDGDTGPGDFDDNQNFFIVNGAEIQNFSAVSTLQTSPTGILTGGTGNPLNGFEDSQLRTGFFFTNNAGFLTTIFDALVASNQLTFRLRDIDPTDNFFDFTQGIDGGLINVGQGPIVTPPPGQTVPEPATVVLVAGGLLGVAGVARRRQRAA